jgi:hypothetical protein
MWASVGDNSANINMCCTLSSGGGLHIVKRDIKTCDARPFTTMQSVGASHGAQTQIVGGSGEANIVDHIAWIASASSRLIRIP